MSLVQPTILDLLPEETITLTVAAGIGHGGVYSLVIHLETSASSPITVTVKLKMSDPALYKFVGGLTEVMHDFQGVVNGDLVEFPFAIENVVVLTGMPLRMTVAAWHQATPANKLFDAANYNVVYH